MREGPLRAATVEWDPCSQALPGPRAQATKGQGGVRAALGACVEPIWKGGHHKVGGWRAEGQISLDPLEAARGISAGPLLSGGWVSGQKKFVYLNSASNFRPLS